MARPAEIQEILAEAAACPAGQIAGLLDRHCGSDAALRAEVESLLHSITSAGRFLAAPTAGPYRDSSDPSGLAVTIAAKGCQLVGACVGPYRLLERLGEGGFGTVYLAEQELPVRRRVALKIIKPGMDSRQVIARFEAERQALALMDHPNISRVLDGGATESQSPFGPDRPYFVMELVRGVPITQFCDEQHLDLRDRLALFIDACHAVQHAHQKGIIHRDLKPSNVLVSRFDDKALVKIIDFGIAKATAGTGPLTDKTLFTEVRQLVGTPAYMSPEQAGLSDLDIDTRSDIYSLGVLLYELLTGVTPFDAERLRHADFDELRRIIREEEPPRPSTRLSSRMTANGSAGVPLADSSRSLDPSIHRSLLRSLRGDLDWIVMRCLEKDRARRYETASALAADVERHLNGEPIEAKRSSSLYVLRKMLQRHRIPATVAAAFVALILCGTVIATVLWQRAERQGEHARQVAIFMEQTLAGIAPEIAAGRDTKLLEAVLNSAAARIRNGELRNAPDAELRLRLTIGNVYRALAAYDAAHGMLDPVVEMAEKSYGRHDEKTAVALSAVANLFFAKGDRDRAVELFNASLATYQRAGIESGEVARTHYDLATCLGYMMRADEALVCGQAGLAIARKHFDDRHKLVLEGLTVVAGALADLPRDTEALAIYAELLPALEEDESANALHLARALTDCGGALLELDRAGEALDRFNAALAIRKRLYPDGHPELASAFGLAAEQLRQVGRVSDALALARESVGMFRAHPEWGPRGERTNCEWYLGHILCDAGDADAAIASLREFMELSRQSTLDGPMVHWCSQMQLAWTLLHRAQPGDAAEAEALMRACVAAIPEDFWQSWMRFNAMSVQGEALTVLGRYAEAEPLVLAGYDGLKNLQIISPARIGKDFKGLALTRVRTLYENWSQAQASDSRVRAAFDYWRSQSSNGTPGTSARSPPNDAP